MGNYTGSIFLLSFGVLACVGTAAGFGAGASSASSAKAAAEASLKEAKQQVVIATGSLAKMRESNAHVLEYKAAWDGAFAKPEAPALVAAAKRTCMDSRCQMTAPKVNMTARQPFGAEGKSIEVAETFFTVVGDGGAILNALSNIKANFPAAHITQLHISSQPGESARCDVSLVVPKDIAIVPAK